MQDLVDLMHLSGYLLAQVSMWRIPSWHTESRCSPLMSKPLLGDFLFWETMFHKTTFYANIETAKLSYFKGFLQQIWYLVVWIGWVLEIYEMPMLWTWDRLFVATPPEAQDRWHEIPRHSTKVSFEMRDMCILISRPETWIIQKVSRISACNGHHSLTFSNSFPMIPNT